MASSRKKTIARKFSQDWVAGYLPASGFLRDGFVELLALDGKTVQIPASELKWICYVRDFNSGEVANPERLLRKTFTGRPRSEGLQLRIHLSDGEILEGMAANDRSLVAGEGIFLTPPDIRSNTQRIWVPPGAIAQLEVLAVIGAAKRSTPKPARVPTTEQESLF
ncbi:MAG TPA: hypothetical protein VMU92_05805 [Acidobacteriaceae bacterium]|nr:hypothetical protein [Acidobacteriaceae bacterium]